MKIEDTIHSIVAQAAGVDTDNVKPSSTMDDFSFDSLDGVELIMSVEEEFGIEIPDADAEKISTVEDITNYITKKIEDNNEKLPPHLRKIIQ